MDLVKYSEILKFVVRLMNLQAPKVKPIECLGVVPFNMNYGMETPHAIVHLKGTTPRHSKGEERRGEERRGRLSTPLYEL